MNEWIGDLERVFHSQRNELQAEKMSAYMKGLFRFYGISSTQRKAIAKDYLKRAPSLDQEQKRQVIKALWNAPHRELHYTAQEWALKWKCFTERSDIDLIHYLITHSSWWDTVDFIASNLLGAYMRRHPEQQAIIDAWNRDENMWLVRSTLLYQLKYKEETDMQRLEALIEPHVADREFFIKKAIGWALRQASKHQPDEVLEIIARQPLQRLSMKEASKYL